MLPYEEEIFRDLMDEDGLVILARGLGVDRILVPLLKLHCDPTNLVLVINAAASEEEYLCRCLQDQGVTTIPKLVTSDYTSSDRKKLYLEGGVLFVSSRILVVDMLTDVVPTDLILGIYVHNAHKVVESCQEAFILRLFRQRNKTGFVRAFSDHPQAFCSGFSKVEKVMKSLYVGRLLLYPRFQASVIDTMDRHEVEVVELGVPLTDNMKSCQMSLLDLINLCVKELKSCNTWLDLEEVTVETVITRSFDSLVRVQLDPVWQQLSFKTKQLVHDLKTLRELLRYLDQYDCVTFYNALCALRSSEQKFSGHVGWLVTDAADQLFLSAKRRVEKDTETKKSGDSTKKLPKSSTGGPKPGNAGGLEANPKWAVVDSVLEEIERENRELGDTELGPGRTLVITEEEKSCKHIREYIQDGGEALLKRIHTQSERLKQEQRKKGKQEPEQTDGGGRFKAVKRTVGGDQITLTQIARGEEIIGAASKKKSAPSAVIDLEEENEEEPTYRMELNRQPLDISESSAPSGKPARPQSSCPSVVVLHALRGQWDPHSTARVLASVSPRYVLMYDANLSVVRQLEVYRASRPGLPLRVYFLIFKESAEEQRYLTSIRKEKEAFESLIRQKGTMVIPADRDGKLIMDMGSSAKDVSLAGNSRKGGVEEPVTKQVVLVDMREFRSDLPFLLHQFGFHVDPLTIEVGDYILTPDVCVERKSVSDLIGSLGNGRLYTQCVNMTRYYKRAVLLIEFDPNKSFVLKGKYSLHQDVSISDVQSKLALLTIHFPALRILWSQSPRMTSSLFQSLKRDHDQPNTEKALSISKVIEAKDTSVDVTESRYSHASGDALLKVPGVSTKTWRRVMDKGGSLHLLSKASVDHLVAMLGNKQDAKSVWEFFHRKVEDGASRSIMSLEPVTSPKKGKVVKGNERGFGRRK